MIIFEEIRFPLIFTKIKIIDDSIIYSLVKLFIINGNNLFVTVSLFNAIGQEVLNEGFTSSVYTVNCDELSNGIYFAKLEMGSEVVVRKIVLGK